MDYRSDVSISIDTKQFKKDIFLQKIPDNLFEDFEETHEGEYINFFIENVKWHKHYPDAYAIEAYLDTLLDTQYHFIRVGENDGDIVNEGHLLDDRCTQTKIYKY